MCNRRTSEEDRVHRVMVKFKVESFILSYLCASHQDTNVQKKI